MSGQVSAGPGGANVERLGDGASDRAWADFAEARDAKVFCQSWLSIQCETVGEAQAGLLLLEEGGRFAPAAIWPSRAVEVTHLTDVAQQAMGEKRAVVVGPAAGRGAQVSYPILVKGSLQGVVVLELKPGAGEAVQPILRQLHWGTAWVEALFLRRRIDLDAVRVSRTTGVLDVLAQAGEQERLQACALAAVNDLAARLSCSRVSVGLASRKGVRLLAISDTAYFHRNSRIVGTIENAMEEAADQAAPVSLPATPGTARRIALAHRDLLREARGVAALSAPLVGPEGVTGALTLERSAGAPFTDAEVEFVDAAGALLGPLLASRAKAERLFAGRIVDGAGGALAGLFGRGRLALKAGVVAAVALVAGLAFAQGDFRVSARASVEGAAQQAAVAPFEGYVAAAPRRAGDRVRAGEVLARLDDRDYALEALRWRSEREQQVLKYDEALGQHDRAAARIADAMIRQADAQLALAEAKVQRAEIKAPYDGTILSGDLSQKIGTPVDKGEVLFEIAPADSYRVVLQVDEKDLAQLGVGDEGEVVLAGLSDRSFPVRVARITPVSSTEAGANTFRVEAEPVGETAGLRAGMDGVAKIRIDRRSLLAIWGRPIGDWLRYQAWVWRP